jgi:hypothetical protein
MGFSSTLNPQPLGFVRTFSGHRAAGGILRTLPLTAARSCFQKHISSRPALKLRPNLSGVAHRHVAGHARTRLGAANAQPSFSSSSILDFGHENEDEDDGHSEIFPCAPGLLHLARDACPNRSRCRADAAREARRPRGFCGAG